MEAAAAVRTADPWRDTDVIDQRAPRFNQAVVGSVALLGAVFGWPLAWAIMCAQLLIGLTLGRRFCLPCLAYFGSSSRASARARSRTPGRRGSPT